VVDVDEERGLLGVGGEGEKRKSGGEGDAAEGTAEHADHLNARIR
jgi:hypothetical protein